MKPLRLLVGLLVAASWVSPATALDLGPLEVGGWAKAAVQAQPGVDADPWPFAGPSLGLDAEAAWGDWLVRASVEATGDLSNLGQGATGWATNPFAPPAALRYRAGDLVGLAAVKELYAEVVVGDLLVRGGQQIFTWGLADGNNPTDTLNPRWIGTRFTTTLDEQKIAVPGLLVEWALPNNLGEVEAVVLSWAVPSVLPATAFTSVTGSGVVGDPLVTVTLHDPVAPEASGRTVEGGARALFYLGSASFSLSWLTQFDKTFDLDVETTLTPAFGPPTSIRVEQTPVYHRVFQWGADFAWPVAGWDLRGEGAFVLTADPSGDDLYTKNPFVKGVVQLSRSWANGLVTTSLSWAPTWVVAHRWWQDYDANLQAAAFQIARRNGQAYAFENALGLRLATKLANETFQPEVLALVNLAARDSLVSLTLPYNLADGWNLKAGVTVYSSLDPEGANRELGVFGNRATDAKDGGFVELRYDF